MPVVQEVGGGGRRAGIQVFLLFESLTQTYNIGITLRLHARTQRRQKKREGGVDCETGLNAKLDTGVGGLRWWWWGLLWSS